MVDERKLPFHEQCWNVLSHERKLEIRELARQRLAGVEPVKLENGFAQLTGMHVPLDIHSWLRAESTRHDLTTRQIILECCRAAMEGRPYDPKPPMTPAEKKFLAIELQRQRKFAAAAAAKAREKSAGKLP